MSSTSRLLCRFINTPEGCKRGKRCSFSHDLSIGSSSSRSSGGAAARDNRSNRTPLSPSAPNRREGGAPRNVCDFFWKTGQCTRGFDCTFKHLQKSNGDSTPQHDTPPPNTQEDLDFSTTEGLADINNIVPDPQFRLNPIQAHNEIKEFVSEYYSFPTHNAPSAMIKFARILASIDKRNGLWNTDDAQAFLQTIVQGNALKRVTDILQSPHVSSRSGMGFSTISFQTGYFPVLQFAASDLILKSTLHHNLNALYTAVDASFDSLCETVTKCMNEMILNKTWKDVTPALPFDRQSQLTGIVVFSTLSTLIQQFFFRFKNAIHNHPCIVTFIGDIRSWFDTWSEAISRRPPAFEDNLDEGLRSLTVGQIAESIGRLQEIIRRVHTAAQSRRRNGVPKATISDSDRKQALLTRLRQSYDPPGDLRNGGPRHNNDSVEISNVRIVPTHEELLCPTPAYLPINLPEAPHHCRPESMEKVLDIQFRLLREELVAPIRESISIIQDDLNTVAARLGKRERTKVTPTQLEEVIARNGGMYRTKGHNSVMFQIYTNVEFAPLKAERRGFTVGLVLDAPPGGARSAEPSARQEYWKHAGSKRLTSGSLVALLLVRNFQVTIFLGSVVSSNSELVDSSKFYDSSVEIRINFMDPEVELMALRRDKATVSQSQYALLIDNGVMFESIRPFLDTLQAVEPTSIQFHRYLCPAGNLDQVQVLPPKITRSPTFKYNLECLARPGEYIHSLQAGDQDSIRRARFQLKLSSFLDASQADAMVDALTREVALIQGPPGTGKSYTGKEILRVLFQSKIRPVVLIAFTNHALDHMLLSLLDANITSDFVRLGSRTTNERIAEYSLDKLERTVSEKSTLDRTVRKEYASMKGLEETMKKILEQIQIPEVTLSGITAYLEASHPSQLESVQHPPYWIEKLYEDIFRGPDSKDDNAEAWTRVSHKKRRAEDKQIADTMYGFWKLSQDLEFIRPPTVDVQEASTSAKGKARKKAVKETPAVRMQRAQAVLAEHKIRMHSFFGALGFGDLVPPLPQGQRPIDQLLRVDNVWSMSVQERLTMALYWENCMRQEAYRSCLHEYESARKDYEEACKRYNDAKDENRRRLLSSVDLIGCTTNGAAKLTSLLTTVAPKVLVVEEAGQVLEAHILASLKNAVQHLICIGDPQQLRPNIANYSLSMDSERGRELFKFDRSLMERLSDMGLPMSQINVQRRMRPSISAYIRNILYPNLEDHLLVTKYPKVQGMQQDVFFLSHTNKENGGDEEASVSKSNTFEVQMIVDLVMYFLKQEGYNAPGDIAVLCAYLGQLQKVKAALRNLMVAVSLDERDEEQLVRQGMEEEGTVEQVVVARHIRLGTVDIFQGEEAKIVIVSLVRNSGSFEGSGAAIGFLKSSNRINVALSRAQHGLYVLGNASNLRENNQTWRTIVDGMEQAGQIGYGFPIVCPRHADEQRIVCNPGELSRGSPEGGCLRDCGFRMECGHDCPSGQPSWNEVHERMPSNSMSQIPSLPEVLLRRMW
ncbi:hypothetical protein D9757_009973 [Collybiopsis confluens]|uniref:C3H1-type domain-containing protein n=1 Tax=Collybiopsis confluens TaxID=2823264 RepID=A0A8H5LW00_9AGAR|nr:hypothetical protein D9757_009973 [Collybiopsis confluens]